MLLYKFGEHGNAVYSVLRTGAVLVNRTSEEKKRIAKKPQATSHKPRATSHEPKVYLIGRYQVPDASTIYAAYSILLHVWSG
jgi:hypothetical protein